MQVELSLRGSNDEDEDPIWKQSTKDTMSVHLCRLVKQARLILTLSASAHSRSRPARRVPVSLSCPRLMSHVSSSRRVEERFHCLSWRCSEDSISALNVQGNSRQNGGDEEADAVCRDGGRSNWG